jgi:hypothetical protein
MSSFCWSKSQKNNHWLVVSTPLKNMFVSWDDDIPNIWEKNPNVPNHQPDHLVPQKPQSQ